MKWTRHENIHTTKEIKWAKNAMWPPSVLHKNGQYYFMWSEGNWQGPHHCVAYAMADSPFGPFTRIGKLPQQNPAIATGARHHSIIHLPEQDRWFTIYHRRPLTETDANSREICIDEMRFD